MMRVSLLGVSLLFAVPAGAAEFQQVLDLVRPLVGEAMDSATRALRKPAACEVAMAHPPGCSYFSCCSPGRQTVSAVCGTLGRQSARVHVALIPEDGQATAVRVKPSDTPITGATPETAIAVRYTGSKPIVSYGDGVTATFAPDGAIEMVAMVDSTHRQQAEDCVLDPEQPFPLFDNQVEHLSAPTVRPALSPAGGTIVVPPTKSKDQF
jgi:hypothetical protein